MVFTNKVTTDIARSRSQVFMADIASCFITIQAYFIVVDTFSTYVCSAHSARYKMCIFFTTNLAQGPWFVVHSQYFLSIGAYDNIEILCLFG